MKASEKLLNAGFEDVLVLENFSYDDALIGVTTDNRAVYSYSKMVEWLVRTEGCTDEEAQEWIQQNTIKGAPYFGPQAPIIMYDVEDSI